MENEKKQKYRRLQVEHIWLRTVGEIIALIAAITICSLMIVSGYEESYSEAASRTAREDSLRLAESVGALAESELINVSEPERSAFIKEHCSEMLSGIFLEEDLLYSGAIYYVDDTSGGLFASSSMYLSTLAEHGLLKADGTVSDELRSNISAAAAGTAQSAVLDNVYMSFVPCYDDSGLFAIAASAVTYRESMEYDSLVKDRIIQISIVSGILIIAYYCISAARSYAHRKKAEENFVRQDSSDSGEKSSSNTKEKSKKIPDASKSKFLQPNVLKVSLLVLIEALLGSAAYYIYFVAAQGRPTTAHTVAIGVLLFACALIFVQFIIWAIVWVSKERVSELGLHIVRFAVILTAVALTVFIMLSIDYSTQYTNSLQNALRQQVLASRIDIQKTLGTEEEFTTIKVTALGDKIDALAENSGSDRRACLYLIADEDRPIFNNTRFSSFGTSSSMVAASSNEEIFGVSESFIMSVVDTGRVVFTEYTAGSDEYYAAFCPVFTEYGCPMGVLEISEIKQPGSVFRFTTVELWLMVAAVIVLFSFTFYGFMQFFDIVLRPKNFDRSRLVLSCGREAARPMLFFSAFVSALPAALLLFSKEMQDMFSLSVIPEAICAYLPVLAYCAAVCLGMLFVKKRSESALSELPSAIGLAAAFVCNLAMLLLLHIDSLRKFTEFNNRYTIIALIMISGIGCGMSYRTTTKFQEQSDACFGHDKYAYLCTSLGIVAGILAGATLFVLAGEQTLRIVICALTLFTMLLSIALLEDLKRTVKIKGGARDEMVSYAGILCGIVPSAVIYCLVGVYASRTMLSVGAGQVPVLFCVIAPIIAFCFGNRLRVGRHSEGEKKKQVRKLTMLVGAVVSALSVVPMLIMPAGNEILFSTIAMAVMCIGVIFLSCAAYSMLKTNEIRKIAAWVRALALIFAAAAVCATALLEKNILMWIYIAAAVLCVVLAVVSMMSKAPVRPEKKKSLGDVLEERKSDAIEEESTPAIALPASSSSFESRTVSENEPIVLGAPQVPQDSFDIGSTMQFETSTSEDYNSFN